MIVAPGIVVPVPAVLRRHGGCAAARHGAYQQHAARRAHGNLDNKDLIAGTPLNLPVDAAGALFLRGMPMPPRDTARLTCPPLRQGIAASSS